MILHLYLAAQESQDERTAWPLNLNPFLHRSKSVSMKEYHPTYLWIVLFCTNLLFWLRILCAKYRFCTPDCQGITWNDSIYNYQQIWPHAKQIYNKIMSSMSLEIWNWLHNVTRNYIIKHDKNKLQNPVTMHHKSKTKKCELLKRDNMHSKAGVCISHICMYLFHRLWKGSLFPFLVLFMIFCSGLFMMFCSGSPMLLCLDWLIFHGYIYLHCLGWW